MEHSALHGLLLTGLIIALGGPIAVLFLYRPAARVSGLVNDPNPESFTANLMQIAARWTAYGALGAAFATFVDFFVQVAELQGQTLFGGADFSVVLRFATHTTVGRLDLARLGLLLLTAWATRLRIAGRWQVVALLATGSIVVTSLVSHAAAQPDYRVTAITVQITHIMAAALWMGVPLQLFMARGRLLAEATHQRVAFIAEVVRRFSPIALATTSLLGITGVLAAWRSLDSISAVFTSPYGLTLVVKLTLLTPAIYAGFTNFRRIGPKLRELVSAKSPASECAPVLKWFSRMLELEITAGTLVITVAGILGSVSPPGPDGSQRLTAAQTRAVLTPHWPTTDVSAWNHPDDPRGPTIGDLHYSEFTHNSSGIMVFLLGLSWMAQGIRGTVSKWAARLSPFLLVPFGCFIAILANPELWLLHQYGPMDALRNPILLEHQLGALMVFLIAWLTWRDRLKPDDKKPLGYPLPAIMILGSLLLLGHAHSATSIPDDLTNLINVQHAVFGALGLFAGTTRLLMLRGLVPAKVARFVWPGFVVMLGLFMTFIYREAI